MINVEMLATWLPTIVAGVWFIVTEVKVNDSQTRITTDRHNNRSF